MASVEDFSLRTSKIFPGKLRPGNLIQVQGISIWPWPVSELPIMTLREMVVKRQHTSVYFEEEEHPPRNY